MKVFDKAFSNNNVICINHKINAGALRLVMGTEALNVLTGCVFTEE